MQTPSTPEKPSEINQSDKPINTAVEGDSRWLVTVKGKWAKADGSPGVMPFTARLMVACQSRHTAPELALSYLYRLGACAHPEATKATGVELLPRYATPSEATKPDVEPA